MGLTVERLHAAPVARGASPFEPDGACADLLSGAATLSQRTYLNVVREWGQSIEFGEPALRGHGARVAAHATGLAKALGVDAPTTTAILFGAFLHDIGRLRVPRAIRESTGVLSAEELAVVRRGPVFGADILSNITLPWDVTPIVRWHNERFDGGGYPDGLRGDEIPLPAQIVGIAHVFDALTSPRTYRAALRPDHAVRELASMRERWSSDVFHACLERLQESYAGSLCLV